MQAFSRNPQMNAGTIFGILGEFIYLFIASCLLGAAFGLVVAILLKYMHANSIPQVPSSPPPHVVVSLPCQLAILHKMQGLSSANPLLRP